MQRSRWIRTLVDFRLTIVGAVFGLLIYLVSTFTSVEVFETIAGVLARFERYQVDEVVVGLILVALGCLADLWRARSRRRQQSEILRHRQVASRAVLLSAKEVVGTFQDDFRSLIVDAASDRVSDDQFLEDLGQILSTMTSQLEDLGRCYEVGTPSSGNQDSGRRLGGDADGWIGCQ